MMNPIPWKTPSASERIMLDNLQPNILKPHVRDCLTILFLEFTDTKAAASALGEIATSNLMKSALQHLVEVDSFKRTREPGSAYVGVGLTAEGYKKFGIAPDKTPADPSFQRGMQTAPLNDPNPAEWESQFLRPLHAIILIGDALTASRDTALGRVEKILDDHGGCVITARQEGLGRHNINGDGIEHFGYVDGRSQPLFFVEDIQDELDKSGGNFIWNPAFGPDLAIVEDPAAPDPGNHFGSYFIFRKLEQNVRAFKQQEESMALTLPLPAGQEERMGALMVGRFEDGTPVTLRGTDGLLPVTNNFDFATDGAGARCPLFGHIRKTNPRGSGGFEQEPDERLHQMPRRGQTYGARSDGPNDGRIENKPTGGVGLLFMAFNSVIGNQFEFMQRVWANNENFPKVPAGSPAPGLDPIIGQGRDPRAATNFPKDWDDASSLTPAPQISQVVHMKGGEYFFMPSLPFLRGLLNQEAIV